MNLSSLFRRKSIAKIQKDAAAGFGDEGTHGLKRALSVTDLTLLGVAAVIGAGIFSTIGQAASAGGPGVALLFVFTAIACGFAALCYAEFASMIPVAGSAYTYAYASFGELMAWIIGWDLLMEYAIGNIAVAISWSDYFTTLLADNGIRLPYYLQMDFLTAKRGFDEVSSALAAGESLEMVSQKLGATSIEAYEAWRSAPSISGWPLVCDLPALAIVLLITTLVYVGIRESKTASNAMVVLKLAVIVVVILVGSFYIKVENWNPFMPNGIPGVLKGVAAVFFAYIGFDAISTTAEECKNPQRDLPRGMIYSLGICTLLYILISLVLTGMVSYKELAVGDPMAYVFGPSGANLLWVKKIVAISAVFAMATVLLVFQLGQPRIWMAMSRDGLLPSIFSRIHPKYKTPSFSTIVAGVVVAFPALFMNLKEVTDLTSIGTLFAFMLVCGGVLVLEQSEQPIERKFRVPYINSKYLAPALLVTCIILLVVFNFDGLRTFFNLAAPWDEFKHRIPMWGFIFGSIAMVVMCYRKSLSLIPVLGLLSCGYLMTELGWTNWVRFIVWLAAGLTIYFTYGFWHSKLRNTTELLV